MTHPLPTTPSTETPLQSDRYAASLLRAAEAVLACLHPRAPLRLAQVSLDGASGVSYALAPDPEALALNRGLREEVVLVALAQTAVARLLELPAPPLAQDRDPRSLLAAALRDPEELGVLDAQLAVLEARARATLRRSWAEVEVVAAGLRDHGTLDAQAVAHRIACAQGIRGTLLN
ncbi:hypothetical protein DEIPH_ctg079orf0088 [Deinococcus phoenicis]|uniref:Uncharacterized protein n=1 Tax=Deinococcus phoenicis TaxID=1476583 RepID=A0A016QLD5_9DEIO|nr:hypothetical protein [Deinococcus phoenicis]EYB66692.1 hypothetical protein DEIPH_ctg079orf0088 [Deinococcus phoenicis]